MTLNKMKGEARKEYRQLLEVFNIKDKEPEPYEVKMEAPMFQLLEKYITLAHAAGVEQERKRAVEDLERMCFCKDDNHTGSVCPIGEGYATTLATQAERERCAEIARSYRPDERKVASFGEYQAETYDEKMFAGSVCVTIAQAILTDKEEGV